MVQGVQNTDSCGTVDGIWNIVRPQVTSPFIVMVEILFLIILGMSESEQRVQVQNFMFYETMKWRDLRLRVTEQINMLKLQFWHQVAQITFGRIITIAHDITEVTAH